MKTYLRLTAACLVLPGLLSLGCGDDDDDGGSNGPDPTATPVATSTPGGNTPVPTATPGGDDTPTPTPGGGNGVSREVQAFVGSGIANIGNIGMTGSAPAGGGAGLIPFPITSPCTESGTVTVDCTGTAPIMFSSDFDMCLNQVPGLTSFIDGLIVVESNGSCINPFPTGQTVIIEFNGELDIDNQNGGSFAGTLDSVSEVTALADGTSEIDTSGTMTADCIGGTATFDTTETIVTPPNGPCPTAGRLEFDIDGESHVAEYNDDGSVVIDGESFGSCEDLAPCE